MMTILGFLPPQILRQVVRELAEEHLRDMVDTIFLNIAPF
jgi:hypothetical protein